MYDIQWDIPQRSLSMRLSGFWTEETMRGYEYAVRQAVSAPPVRPFGLLVDLSDHPPQAGDIVERQSAVLSLVGTAGLSAIAVVGASTLMRRQAQRAAGDLPMHFTDTPQGARAWLTGAI